jgi:hypothetical protein
MGNDHVGAARAFYAFPQGRLDHRFHHATAIPEGVQRIACQAQRVGLAQIGPHIEIEGAGSKAEALDPGREVAGHGEGDVMAPPLQLQPERDIGLHVTARPECVNGYPQLTVSAPAIPQGGRKSADGSVVR